MEQNKNKLYFFCNEGTISTGPFTIEQLKNMKTITPKTLFWTKGMEDWEAGEHIRDLEDLFHSGENAKNP